MMQQPQAAVMGSVQPGMNVVQGSRPTKMMSPIDSITSCMKGSTSFDGRASRSEFWWFYLFYVVCGQILNALAIMLDQPMVSLAIFALVPAAISSSARRLHDGGRSGWNLLWVLTIIGAFVVLYWYIEDGEFTDNAYGPVPTNEP
jgi:uncharacterized membrane protein YhaH (DUF805 family)